MFSSLLVGLLCVVGAEPPKPNSLTPEQIKAGSLLLFDGVTSFGWTIEGDHKVQAGALVLGGEKKTVATTNIGFLAGNFSAEATDGQGKNQSKYSFGWAGDSIQSQFSGALDLGIERVDGNKIRITVAEKKVLRLSNLIFTPTTDKKLFNGKDLSGWKINKGEKYKSKFEVTKDATIRITDGPGDLQTEGEWADFILQLDCKTNGKHLNSGVFFRCIPDEYQQGYEAQIRNQWEGEDRTKPVDFGTGAIYRRQAARKVVSDDKEWFTMTVIAHGKTLATWVNGYPVACWTDDRKEDKNARQGCKTTKGAISFQGHDPTTDIEFKNIRIVGK